MQMPGVRDKCMKLSQGKSPGKEPLSRQLLCLATLRASPAMQSVQRGGCFNFLSSPSPLFRLNSTCRQQKLPWFFAGLISHSISISHLHIEAPLWKKFSMPTESSPSEVAPSGFLPNIFSRRQEGFGVTRGSPLCCQALCCDSSLQLTSKFLILFFFSF